MFGHRSLYKQIEELKEQVYYIMGVQDDVNAAVAAIQAVVQDLTGAVTRIQSEIQTLEAQIGTPVDTSQLDAAVTALQAVQGQVDGL